MEADFVLASTKKTSRFVGIIDQELKLKQTQDLESKIKPLFHDVIPIEIIKFTDGERFSKITKSVGGYNVHLTHQFETSEKELLNDVFDLLAIEDALKRASVNQFSITLPYFPFARMDRKEDGRVPITAKLFMDLITTAGGRYLNRISIFDLHSSQEQGFYNGPMDNMYARPMFEWYIANVLFKDIFDKKEQNRFLVLGAPDAGAVKNTRRIANNLGLDYAFADKARNGHITKGNIPIVNNVYGNVKNKTVIIIDDIVGTLGTVDASTNAYFDNGATDVMFMATHGIFNYSVKEGIKTTALERINKNNLRGKIYVTDTIPRTQEEINQLGIIELSLAPITAEAIYKREHRGQSVSELALPSLKEMSLIFERSLKQELYVRKPQ